MVAEARARDPVAQARAGVSGRGVTRPRILGNDSALTRLEAGIGFANHIHPATPFDDLAIGVAGLGSFQRGQYFHHFSSCSFLTSAS